MLVRDIIKDTIWIPGDGYTLSHKPKISVLLPTYRRAKNGLFKKAVESVLSQTLTDIELIIVDDASTDGTADQIAEFMARDDRVSCLRHIKNVGLPAVSELEAYLRARADYIAFAFDDDFFYPDALESLLSEAKKYPSRVCFGTTVWKLSSDSSESIIRFGQSLSSVNLRGSNYISNISVLLPRTVIEDVGFYDPHISMLRLCDWDLWRRVGEKYLLHHVDVNVGEVTGITQADSLGNTIELSAATSEERMRNPGRKLRPNDLLDADVFEIDPSTTNAFKLSCSDLREAHVAKRTWLGTPLQDNEDDQDKLILVVTDYYSASVSLCFDHLPDEVGSRIRIVPTSQAALTPLELAHASCLIVVRRIEHHREWIEAAAQLGIPTYFFLDDNYPELTKEGYPMAEDVSASALRSKLKNFSGVLLSSQALCAYFNEHLIHPQLFFFPVSYARQPNSKRRTEPSTMALGEWQPDVTVASLGGPHRNQGFRDCVLPAIHRASTSKRILVVSSEDDKTEKHPSLIDSENVRFATYERQSDLDRALIQLTEYSPDILIHAPSETVNAAYKTLNIALCAYILDAVLVVPDRPPFDTPEFNGAIKVSSPDKPASWLKGLTDLMARRGDWDSIKSANALYCRREFSGEQNLKVLKQALATAPVVRATTAVTRLKTLSARKTSALSTDIVFDTGQLNNSLKSVASLRKRSFRSKILMPWRRPSDLWPLIAPAFADIKRHVGSPPKSTTLELSGNLHELPYIEYRLDVQPGKLLNLTAAFSSEGAHDGLVGIEFVDSAGEIVVQSTRDVRFTDFNAPVIFDLKGASVANSDTWRLRIFSRSQWPIYTFEFASYSMGGLRRRSIAPFARINYA